MEVCLAASKVEQNSKALDILRIATTLCTSEVPLLYPLTVARAKSVALRVAGQRDQAEQVLCDALLISPSSSDERTMFVRGQLVLSKAENAILENRYEEALGLVDEIVTQEQTQSTLRPSEEQLLRLNWTVRGRIFKVQGSFGEAERSVQACMAICQKVALTKVNHVARHLADVLCEQGQHARAKELIDPLLDDLATRGKLSTKPYRRLLLPYIDALILGGEYSAAEIHLDLIYTNFQKEPPVDPTDELNHVRTAVGLMRLSIHKQNFLKAVELATFILHLIDQYQSFTPDSYYHGYILSERAACYLQMAQTDMSAVNDCNPKPRHFIMGIGTFERRNVEQRLQSSLERCVDAHNTIQPAWSRVYEVDVHPPMS